jgi:glycosyltransferase involved in cell wall biosynthesis
VDGVLSQFGPSREEARRRYQSFVHEDVGETIQQGLRQEIYLGDEPFVTRMQRRAKVAGDTGTVPRAQRCALATPVGQIAQDVVKETPPLRRPTPIGKSPNTLVSTRRRWNGLCGGEYNNPRTDPAFATPRTGWPWTDHVPRFSEKYKPFQHLPRIAIVTPSFNQGDYIEATIRSILLQRYPALDYVIMDGGSTDGTLDIVRRYQPWLTYWESTPDNGQYQAIGRGFSHTSGEIMLWLNSDDMLMPNSLWAVASIFASFPEVEWITGIPFLWTREGSFYQVLLQLKYHRRLMALAAYEGRAIHWVMQEATVWRRTLWDRAGGRIETGHPYAGDFELWLRFASHAQLYTVAALIGGNRQHPAQKTAAQDLYCRDVDAVLKSRPKARIFNRVVRLRFVKLMVRLFILTTKMRNHIYFDAKADRWAKQ